MKSPKYLKFVRTLPCCHCDNPETVAHHLIGIGDGMMGGKASDIATMPLCTQCHDLVHRDAKNWPQMKWILKTQQSAIDEGVLKL